MCSALPVCAWNERDFIADGVSVCVKCECVDAQGTRIECGKAKSQPVRTISNSNMCMSSVCAFSTLSFSSAVCGVSHNRIQSIGSLSLCLSHFDFSFAAKNFEE